VPERDRDQSVEQLLRRVMSDDITPLEEACVDGETIAAWSEGSLRAAEASAVERHVAGCSRCRALMASFVRTTPPQPVAESLWRRWHLAWAVPLATAATAAAIWVILPDTGTAPLTNAEPIGTIARDERALTSPPPPAAQSSPVAAAPSESAAAIQSQQRAKVAESSSNELRQRADTSGNRSLADQVQAPAIARSPAEASPAAPAPPEASFALPAPAAAGAAAERAEADTKKEVATNSAPAPLAAARQAFAPIQIVAPGGTTRWRIVSGQRVERSTNAGADWTLVNVASTGALTAAAAPSATVCWIVGAGGAVYVTTDGARFTRVPFQEIVNLTSVSATDGITATVTSVDGRSWRTTDQGKTWLGVN